MTAPPLRIFKFYFFYCIFLPTLSGENSSDFNYFRGYSVSAQTFGTFKLSRPVTSAYFLSLYIELTTRAQFHKGLPWFKLGGMYTPPAITVRFVVLVLAVSGLSSLLNNEHGGIIGIIVALE